MKKSGILMIAMMLAAGISSVSAADIDFDGARYLGSQSADGFVSSYLNDGNMSCLAMVCPAPEGMSPLEWDECNCRPINIEIVPAIPDAGAPFMTEQACSILDASFLVQPAKEEAVELLKPCLAAISSKYGASLRLLPGGNDLNLLVGDAKNPGKDLQAALKVHLKARADGRFFGHRVVLYAPSARASANKDWLDDAATVYNAVTEDPGGTLDIVVDAFNEHAAQHAPPPGVCMAPHDDRPITSSMSW